MLNIVDQNKKLTPEINRLNKTVEISVSNIDEFEKLLEEASGLSDSLRLKIEEIRGFHLDVTFSVVHSKD